MRDMHVIIADNLAEQPGVLDLLERVCGETGRSPLIRLTCTGRGRSNRPHETGSAVRFKRHGDGWTVAAGRDSAAMIGADTDEKLTIHVRCEQCGTSTLRADRKALEPLLTALVDWQRRKRGAEARDAGLARAAWH